MDQQGSKAVSSRKIPLLDSAICIAGLSGYAYLIAYRFQVGAAEAYGVPAGFVSLRLENILGAAIVAISFLLLYTLTEALGVFIGRRASFRLELISIALPSVLLLAASGLLKPAYFIAAGVILFVVVFSVIWPRSMLWIFERLPQPRDDRPPGNKWPRNLVALAISGLLLFDLSPSFGGLSVHRRVEYPILSARTEEVVLLQYGNTLICAPLVRVESAFLPVYTVYDLERDGPLVFHTESIGPLVKLDAPASVPEPGKQAIASSLPDQATEDASRD